MNKYIFILLFSFLYSSTINAKPTKIMLLGDSLTEDWAFSDITSPRPNSIKNGYRNNLWYMLQDANYDVDFVGTRRGGSAIRPSFDPDHEGYSGLTSQQIADGVGPRIKQFFPHIVLLHIGTNDYSTSDTGVENILKNIDTLEKYYDFPIKIIVARIINKTNYSSIIANFNRNLQRMIDRRVDNGDDIIVVDMEHNAGLRYDTRDFRDFIHPNNAGYHKMAKVWFDAIEKALNPKKDNSFLVPIYNLILN